jgi:hypothetical protein
LERRYAAAVSTDEQNIARDDLIAFLERRLAESEREIARLRALFVDAPEAKL